MVFTINVSFINDEDYEEFEEIELEYNNIQKIYCRKEIIIYPRGRN